MRVHKDEASLVHGIHLTDMSKGKDGWTALEGRELRLVAPAAAKHATDSRV